MIRAMHWNQWVKGSKLLTTSDEGEKYAYTVKATIRKCTK